MKDLNMYLDIVNLRRSYIIDTIFERKIFQDVICEYYDYISEIAGFMKNISRLDNSLYHAILLSSLTEKGVFSGDGTMDYSNCSDFINSHFGINVLFGLACCRHLSDFFQDVFTEYGIDNDKFFCFKSKTSLSKKEAHNAVCNHVINLINYDNNLYGFDGTNNSIFSFISGDTMKEEFNHNPYYLYYKYDCEVIFKTISFAKAHSLVKKYDNFKNEKVISNDEYRDILLLVKKTISNNKSLISDFQNESKSRIKRITF